MSIYLTDFIIFPFIHLIASFLDNSNNCVCNHYTNDLFSFATINKEMYKYMNVYNLINTTKTPYMSIKDSYVQQFIILDNVCIKHHLFSNSTYINNIIDVINSSKNRNDLFMCGKLDNMLFIHCDEIEDCKKFISKYCKNIIIKDSCCNGEGFGIELILN